MNVKSSMLTTAALLALAALLVLPLLPAATSSAAPVVSADLADALFAPVAAPACTQDLDRQEALIGEMTLNASCNSNQCYLACVQKGYWAGYCIGGHCVCQQNPSW